MFDLIRRAVGADWSLCAEENPGVRVDIGGEIDNGEAVKDGDGRSYEDDGGRYVCGGGGGEAQVLTPLLIISRIRGQDLPVPRPSRDEIMVKGLWSKFEQGNTMCVQRAR